MKDILVLIGLGLGIVFLVVGRFFVKRKEIKIAGILLIAVSIIIAAPDIISGFAEGFREGFSS